MKISKDDKKVLKQVVDLVLNAKRAMPAHFSSKIDNAGKERMQSFCVDFDDLNADDEYDMASISWSIIGCFNVEFKNQIEFGFAVHLGEDVIIGSYIINRLGHGHLDYELMKILVAKDIEKIQPGVEFNTNDIANNFSVETYLEYCLLKGKYMASLK